MSSLSVIIITRNEEANIRGCLESIRWADEVIVVDSESTDRTVELARQYTPHIHYHRWNGFGPTKNYALSLATKEWVLSLDADERVSAELADEIRHVVNAGSTRYAAFSIPRRSYFLGRWIKHSGWYPGRVRRLFRRSAARFTDVNVHEGLEVSGEVGELEKDLLHYTDPNLSHYFEKFNRYTSLAAEDLVKAGERFSVAALLVRPAWTFLRMYVLKRGFLDGLPGFILCVLSSCYVFTKYAKLWEHEHGSTGGEH